MKVYVLELMITTPSQSIVEPLGVYSTEAKARKFSKLVKKRFPSTKGGNVTVSILSLEIDEKPPILDIELETNDSIKENLVYLYDNGVLEQFVEQDGSFSYSLTPKFKDLLEQNISKLNK